MKHKTVEGKRWLKQAHHDLLVASKNLENKFFADVCYLSEQAAQKALKGYLYFQGERFVWEHSLTQLVKRTLNYESAFEKFLEKAKVLDQYYIPTRYPDALAPPAVPYESYTKKQAEEAIKIAKEILEGVEEKIKEKTQKN